MAGKRYQYTADYYERHDYSRRSYDDRPDFNSRYEPRQERRTRRDWNKPQNNNYRNSRSNHCNNRKFCCEENSKQDYTYFHDHRRSPYDELNVGYEDNARRDYRRGRSPSYHRRWHDHRDVSPTYTCQRHHARFYSPDRTNISSNRQNYGSHRNWKQEDSCYCNENNDDTKRFGRDRCRSPLPPIDNVVNILKN